MPLIRITGINSTAIEVGINNTIGFDTWSATLEGDNGTQHSSANYTSRTQSHIFRYNNNTQVGVFLNFINLNLITNLWRRIFFEKKIIFHGAPKSNYKSCRVPWNWLNFEEPKSDIMLQKNAKTLYVRTNNFTKFWSEFKDLSIKYWTDVNHVSDLLTGYSGNLIKTKLAFNLGPKMNCYLDCTNVIFIKS